MADINVSGALTPTTANTPLDSRSRKNTMEEFLNMSYPSVGLEVFVIETGKKYMIDSLKSKEVAGIEVPNALVDTYHDVTVSAKDISDLQNQLKEMMGGEGSESAQTDAIDSDEEVFNALAGLSKDDNIKEMIDDAKTEDLTEDQMTELTNLFPTA